MARYSGYPTLIDECKQVSINFLSKHEYLKPGWKNGVITWSRNGEKIGSISIQVITCTDNPYIELDYKWNDKPIKYKVDLVSKPSNLGKGVVWYFICPRTNKRCRKLYLIGDHFLHREAFTGFFYRKQIESKNWRQFDSLFGREYKREEGYELLYSRYFKRMYAGRPTRRYLKVLRLIGTEGIKAS